MPYYVTTPIYYVNAEPHLGHAYSTLAADVLARHMRQRGEDVFFLTGTDEHGEPIETAAEREGVSPQELADRNTAKFEALMPIIDASNDFFIRTSDPRHGERVAEIMQRVYDNGWVSKGVYEGWYCPRCADFKTERELGPGQTCPIHEIPLEREREENWFFRLSAFQERLEGLYEERPDFVVPDFRRNEAVAFIEGGLEDVSLSRPKLKWGMRLPWDPEQRMYVWFDALLNYVTALGFAREGEDLTERFWPASLHVMGKDILKFHAVIWPALLWAADLEPPRRMAIHGYLLMGEKKMSKSLGNVLDPFEAIERFGADALRFYCFREVSFGGDGAISTAGFEARYETELANDFGNLASRVLAMVERYRDGVVPVAQVDAVLQEDFEGVVGRFGELLDRAELSQALEEAWKLVRRLNRYVEETRPWDLAKDEADPERLDEVLYNLAEGLRATTLLLVPYLPQTSEQLLAALGEDSRELSKLGSRRGGQRVERVPPLFPKIETPAH
jgi:methionyl-tRNA synthetase